MRIALLVILLSATCTRLQSADGAAVTPNPRYRLTEISGAGWELSYAKAINSSGMVVGEAIQEHGQGLQAFTYYNGVTTGLATLGGSTSDARGVNNLGEVVGASQTSVFRESHAFKYTGGIMADLGKLGGRTAAANDINDEGQIVGTTDTPANLRKAFLYENGVMKSLGSLGGLGFSHATAINEAGEVTGSTNIPGGGSHAFVYRNGQMIDIGRVNEPSVGNDIDDNGEIVGNFNVAPSGTHAFHYKNGVWTDLINTLGGTFAEAYGINSHGQIVGRAGTVGDEGIHGFLYQDGVMHDVNDLLDESGLGWTVTFAVKINDKGWIAANGLSGDGLNRALLLTPVPEPNSLILALGVAASLVRRKV